MSEIPTPIADEETLFRAARSLEIHLVDGSERVSSQAFSCREMRISVDRAALQNNQPQPTRDRFSPQHRVVSLNAGQIRACAPIIRNDEKGHPIQSYGLDIEPKPLEDNAGHAEIFGLPEWNHKATFRKVAERLALLAKIEI